MYFNRHNQLLIKFNHRSKRKDPKLYFSTVHRILQKVINLLVSVLILQKLLPNLRNRIQSKHTTGTIKESIPKRQNLLYKKKIDAIPH